MVYRIRYHRNDGMDEAIVEANSPTEAVVKFRLVGNIAYDASPMGQSIVSVSAETSTVEGNRL
ncbi:MAG: hypothetical protein SVT52_02975 [Planctomycetota bacterium]|nr:hypothetical protein [Planctomycetota bacterium]